MTLKQTLLASILLSAPVAGCIDDDPPLDGSFSEATYEDRGFAIETAAGLPLQIGILHILVADLSSGDDAGCVDKRVDGDTATFTGAECDPGDASRFEGSATVEGWSDFTDDDDADEMTLTYDSFAISGDGEAMVLDGIVVVSQAADGSGVTEVDLQLEAEGRVLWLEGTLVCDARPAPCDYQDARGSTSALGEFAIEGSIRDRSGVIELIADERMVVDFDAAEDDCAPVTIDGVAVADHCGRDEGDGEQ